MDSNANSFPWAESAYNLCVSITKKNNFSLHYFYSGDLELSAQYAILNQINIPQLHYSKSDWKQHISVYTPMTPSQHLLLNISPSIHRNQLNSLNQCIHSSHKYSKKDSLVASSSSSSYSNIVFWRHRSPHTSIHHNISNMWSKAGPTKKTHILGIRQRLKLWTSPQTNLFSNNLLTVRSCNIH